MPPAERLPTPFLLPTHSLCQVAMMTGAKAEQLRELIDKHI